MKWNYLQQLGRASTYDKQPAVQIMTLHASKGLEFDNVWIMGCEDGNLPHTDSTEEDERRLLYIGMTRARHRLILSSAIEEGVVSRFFEDVLRQSRPACGRYFPCLRSRISHIGTTITP